MLNQIYNYFSTGNALIENQYNGPNIKDDFVSIPLELLLVLQN